MEATMDINRVIGESKESRREFLTNRRTGIGGSDLAAIFELSRWKCAIDVYLDKIGQSEESEITDPMMWGIIHEETIAQHYAATTGRKVRRPSGLRRHPKYPWMIANLDRIILNENRGLECKTAGFYAAHEWGEAGSEDIPTAYMLQVQHYMAVCGYDSFDLAVLIAGNDYRVYPIKRNLKIIANIIEKEDWFWNKCVLPRIHPPAGTSAMAAKSMEVLFGREPGVEVNATPEIDKKVSSLRQAKAAISQAKIDITELENFVKEIMLDQKADTIIGPDYKITWRQTKDVSRFQAKLLRQEEPDMYEKYLMVSPGARPFKLTFSKKDGAS